MGKMLSNANRNVELSAINRGAPDGAGNAEINTRNKLHCHGNGNGLYRDKDFRKVEMTLQKQEYERNCEAVDLHTMCDGLGTEESNTTSEGCQQTTKGIYRQTSSS